jgi:hypothetical protein
MNLSFSPKKFNVHVPLKGGPCIHQAKGDPGDQKMLKNQIS